MSLRTEFGLWIFVSVFLSGLAVQSIGATVDCNRVTSYAERTVCKDPELTADDAALWDNAEAAVASLPQEYRWRAASLYEHFVGERDFCMTPQCVSAWYEHTAPVWQRILDTPNSDEPGLQRALDRGYQTDFTAMSGLTVPVTEEEHDRFLKLCREGSELNALGCLYAAFREPTQTADYVDAACQRQKGAPSALACAVNGVVAQYGLRGRSKPDLEAAERYYLKGCELRAETACAALGDWYLQKGDEAKARAAYEKAVRYGDDGTRLALLDESPDDLFIWTASRPSVAETDFVRRCLAFYPTPNGALKCRVLLRNVQDKRLAAALKTLALDDIDAKHVVNKVRSRSNSVFNFISRGSVGSARDRQDAERMTANLTSYVTDYIVSVKRGASERLYQMIQTRLSGGAFSTIEDVRFLVNERMRKLDAQIQSRLDGKDAAAARQTITFLRDTTEDILTAMNQTMPETKGIELVEALVLTDLMVIADAYDAQTAGY